MKLFQAFTAKVKRHKRQGVVALVMAALLVVADYYVCNMSFPLLDSSESLMPYAYLHNDYDDDTTQFMAANMAYDKELVTAYNEYGDSIGQIPITSRSMLYDFLRILQGSDYKYIFIDVRFEKGLETPVDSALYALMADMPRLVFSNHRTLNGYELDPRAPLHKSAYSDYRHMRLSGFSRYEFIQDGRESVALRMYRDLNGGRIHPTIFAYSDNGALCYNTQFTPIPRSVALGHGANRRFLYSYLDGTVSGEAEMVQVLYPYLGGQIMIDSSEDEIRSYAKDKIVLIGDFDSDRHECYIGEVPGPMIGYYAYRLLCRGDHKVSWALYIGLFLIYFGISFTLLSGVKVLRFRRIWLTTLASLAGWNAILITLQILVFANTGIAISVVVPSITFTATSIIIQLRQSQ